MSGFLGLDRPRPAPDSEVAMRQTGGQPDHAQRAIGHLIGSNRRTI